MLISPDLAKSSKRMARRRGSCLSYAKRWQLRRYFELLSQTLVDAKNGNSGSRNACRRSLGSHLPLLNDKKLAGKTRDIGVLHSLTAAPIRKRRLLSSVIGSRETSTCLKEVTVVNFNRRSESEELNGLPGHPQEGPKLRCLAQVGIVLESLTLAIGTDVTYARTQKFWAYWFHLSDTN